MQLHDVESAAASFVLVSSGIALLLRVLIVDLVHTYHVIRRVIGGGK